MTDDEVRAYKARYRRSIGLAANDRRIASALARAHSLRQFEIDNYWKRSTYFWGFQAVSFAALALLFKDGRLSEPGLVAPVAILGFVTGLTGCLTARGSKFWQENWERHVDLLEENQEGHLTKTVLTTRGSSRSVSRLNERLLELLTIGWLAIFLAGLSVVTWPDLLRLSPTKAWAIQVAVPVSFLAIALVYLFWGSGSELPGVEYRRPDFDQEHDRPPRRPLSPTIIRRS